MFLTIGCMTFIGMCFFKDVFGLGEGLSFLLSSPISLLPFVFANFKPMLTPVATVIHAVLVGGSIVANLHMSSPYCLIVIAICVFHAIRTYFLFKAAKDMLQ